MGCTLSAYAIIESERARTSFLRQSQQMGLAERRGELAVGAAFLCGALALALLGDEHGASLRLALLYVLGVAVAGHIRIDVGSGFTVPTQVLFVPMLFALPAAQVPALIALALALGALPSVLHGTSSPSRLLAVPANSWFALGPALVLELAHPGGPLAMPLVLLAALLAQFGGDFAASAIRERLCGGLHVRELAVEVREVYLIDVALSPLGLLVAIATTGRPWAVVLIAPLFLLLRSFSRERRARLEQLIELGDAYRGTALVLGDVVEADDTYTGEHCRGVVQLAVDVADELGLDLASRRNVEFGALLHDVGKIAVPKEIINKPGRLDEHEWEIIRTHTIEGQRMLERVGGVMREVGEIVRSSHERFDGGGYPDGLRGQAIPLEARIVAACDTYNAMTTTRSYRAAMAPGAARAELIANSGTQFDPRVVQALLRVLGGET
ncbi:MAG TPA: HD-GYP domain-containing protein [Solirubrobacteraceae bacterium]|nr:HD-GYP domain-containing protein [Solirubrobacteraceae bacterium]